MVEIPKSNKADEELSAELSHDVWTVANIITVLRLVLVPYAFVVLINGNSDVSAFALYAGAASTD
ncbi:MAG: CDP-diacylglycerol--glycerol-3-phosphate 3-phosphatidyltransferase, partial [Actinobacteria bacterium]|nr:CDP-diacylglycerol--glycerol-3-phosphate 3-phosphatidyltransferase [Actinomycetota bacterium]